MIIQAVYIALCLVLAYINKRLISYDRRIKHGFNGLFHVASWGAAILITHSWFPAVVMPFIGRLFFDCALNLMRGLPLDYVARFPKSRVDKLEKSVFGIDGLLPKIIYVIIIIGLNIYYYG